MNQVEERSEEDNNADPEWITKLKRNGPIPLLDSDLGLNGWCSPSGDGFQVRGPDYLTTKLKIPAGECQLKPLAFDWLKSSAKIYNIMKHPSSRVASALKNLRIDEDRAPFVWAFNLQVPSRENYSAISYFVNDGPVAEGSLMDRFLKGDDSYRNARLKLIANIVKGPWIVKTAVGEQAICILGRALKCSYTAGENYFVIDVDIGSSMVANAIVHLAFGYITSITVDLAFLIEGQHENELPERLLGAVRFSELQLESAALLEEIESCEGSDSEKESNFSTRLWKSIGEGFSTLLHTHPSQASSSAGDDSV
ncbi:hypothetical protein O6H91_11G099600 [Diphasiastrum complanatum]|nr:hypothetical protein O6H91_11G099600 [Diphasiastrum complanatum]KAJ7539547.1 hypothetical protein O6H91_11G099600 [Diphasiastrum complanatum]KAJ7539548.1 hypothetical protein O6H91_11G099600 [Diphasiastrum complanatum]KAJ7539549.1 hypothetical protein O6H91_11G099600 [Diphasiastrum complanatum]